MKFGARLQLFYFFSLTIIGALLASGSYYLWSNGKADVGQMAEVLESGQKFESMADEKRMDAIRANLKAGKFDSLAESINRLEKDITDVHQNLFGEPLPKSLENSLVQTKSSFKEISAGKSIKSLITGFRGQVSRLNSYSERRDWTTLIRITGRILAKIDSNKINDIGLYDHSKMQTFHKGLERDVLVMKNVAQTSVLNRSQQDDAQRRIKALDEELTTVKKYISKLKSVDLAITTLERDFKNWIDATRPEVSLRKIKFEKEGEYMILASLALSSLCFLMVMVGVSLYWKSKKAFKVEFNNAVLNTLEDGIISDDSGLSRTTGMTAQSRLLSIRQEIQNRMEMGAMFKRSTPFPCAIFTADLHMQWSNKHFYSMFGIDYSGRDEQLSWDDVRERLDIDEKNPFYDCVENGNATEGRIMATNYDEGRMWYEIFVKPIGEDSNKHYFVFMYPIQEFLDAKSGALKEVGNAVIESVNALADLDNDYFFKKRHKGVLSQSELGDTWKHFDECYQKVSKREHEQDVKINALKENVESLKLVLDESGTMISDGLSVFNNQVKHFVDLKDALVHFIDVHSSFENNYFKTSQVARRMFGDEQRIVNSFNQLEAQLATNEKNLDNLKNIKESLRTAKENMMTYELACVRGVEQIMGFAKSNFTERHRSEEVINGLKTNIYNLSYTINDLDKIFADFSALVAKTEMEKSSDGKELTIEVRHNIEEVRRQLENLHYESTAALDNALGSDERLIEIIKKAYEGLMVGRSKLKFLEDKMRESDDENIVPMQDRGKITG